MAATAVTASTSKPSDDQLIANALRQLDSKKPPVVARTARQLMRLAPGDPRIEEALCRRLNDTCLRVRSIAASALGELKEARRMQPAAATINITATGLAGNAIELKACPSYNVVGLKELLAQALATTAANLTIMLETTILEDSWVLREHGVHDGAQVSFMMRSEADANPNVSIQPLVQRLADKNEQCKLEAVRALRQLAPHSQCLVDPLLHCLEQHVTSNGSLTVAIEVAKFLEHLECCVPQFAHILAQGFWFEFNQNWQFFFRQRDPLDRLQTLNTVAEILTRLAPDDFQIAEMVNIFIVLRLRVLGGKPQVEAMAENVIRQLQVDEPKIKDAFLKVLKKSTHWNVLMPAVKALAKLPVVSLRVVEGLLTEKHEVVPQRVVKPERASCASVSRGNELLAAASYSSLAELEVDPCMLASGSNADRSFDDAVPLPDSWEDI